MVCNFWQEHKWSLDSIFRLDVCRHPDAWAYVSIHWVETWRQPGKVNQGLKHIFTHSISLHLKGHSPYFPRTLRGKLYVKTHKNIRNTQKDWWISWSWLFELRLHHNVFFHQMKMTCLLGGEPIPDFYLFIFFIYFIHKFLKIFVFQEKITFQIDVHTVGVCATCPHVKIKTEI